MKQDAISFRNWKQELAKEPFNRQLSAAYEMEIIAFLRHCKTHHAPATVELAKQYLAQAEARSAGPMRDALRWFFVKGRKGGTTGTRATEAPQQRIAAPAPPPTVASALPRSPNQSRLMHPPPASSDLGANTWEAALIQEIRVRGFLWRTEQTYREWAIRFARFVLPRSPHAATGEDVSAFLTAMAVNGRASPSAQKQALNAIVFLMQEALHRELGELDFQRAFPKRRLPTVMSANECRSLFAQMDGTPKLMAELAYGSGLRLMELLRLRVQHADIDRLRVQVIAGKGDRVYGFANADHSRQPESGALRLRASL